MDRDWLFFFLVYLSSEIVFIDDETLTLEGVDIYSKTWSFLSNGGIHHNSQEETFCEVQAQRENELPLLEFST